jgi:hypothetical protein
MHPLVHGCNAFGLVVGQHVRGRKGSLEIKRIEKRHFQAIFHHLVNVLLRFK